MPWHTKKKCTRGLCKRVRREGEEGNGEGMLQGREERQAWQSKEENICHMKKKKGERDKRRERHETEWVYIIYMSKSIHIQEVAAAQDSQPKRWEGTRQGKEEPPSCLPPPASPPHYPPPSTTSLLPPASFLLLLLLLLRLLLPFLSLAVACCLPLHWAVMFLSPCPTPPPPPAPPPSMSRGREERERNQNECFKRWMRERWEGMWDGMMWDDEMMRWDEMRYIWWDD